GAVPRLVRRAVAALADAAGRRADPACPAPLAAQSIREAALPPDLHFLGARVLRALQSPGRVAVVQHRDHRDVALVRGVGTRVVAYGAHGGVVADRQRGVDRPHAAHLVPQLVRALSREDGAAYPRLARDAGGAVRAPPEPRFTGAPGSRPA